MKHFVLAVAGLLLCAGAMAQNWSVSTNVLDYVDLGTMNLEASCGIARRWTLTAGVKYNPFSWGEGRETKNDRQRTVEAGARFWPWHIYSGWWMAGKLKYQEYNRGGFGSPRTFEGDRYGGGISAGYSYMINTHLNLDFGLGLWSGYDKYVEYECQNCGRTVGGGDKIFILPNDILLTISYIF